jgi:hypothetical protein
MQNPLAAIGILSMCLLARFLLGIGDLIVWIANALDPIIEYLRSKRKDKPYYLTPDTPWLHPGLCTRIYGLRIPNSHPLTQEIHNCDACDKMRDHLQRDDRGVILKGQLELCVPHNQRFKDYWRDEAPEFGDIEPETTHQEG